LEVKAVSEASQGAPEGAIHAEDVLSPLPFHRELVSWLQTNEREQWAWFSSTEFLAEHAATTRLDLLKSCYRFERADHGDFYALVEGVRDRLGVEAPVTLYQAQAAQGMNASLCYVPGEAHLVLEGPLRSTLSEDELRTIVAHELTHYLLWSRAERALLVADQLLSAMAGHSRGEPSHIETARLFRLYLEIHCDRAALAVCPDPLVGISALVKVQTGLADAQGESYLRQAEEIFGAAEVRTEGLTHPESFVRARALKLWTDRGASAEEEISRMVEGPLDLAALSLLGQERLTRLTRHLLQEFFAADWLRTEALVGHARLFFPDFEPTRPPAEPDRTSPLSPLRPGTTTESTRKYLSFVLLDLATVDRSLEQQPLAAALRLATALGIDDEFLTVAAEELNLSKRALGRLRKDAARLDEAGSAPTPEAEA
jgi:hypothetical protein